mmetsp:Transcript_75132/g.215206  ORF Transcript_75132/g.215206 Transcript_75132/m.215206 type:complete len:495 (+) Transcript_75132:229-1713(+)
MLREDVRGRLADDRVAHPDVSHAAAEVPPPRKVRDQLLHQLRGLRRQHRLRTPEASAGALAVVLLGVCEQLRGGSPQGLGSGACGLVPDLRHAVVAELQEERQYAIPDKVRRGRVIRARPRCRRGGGGAGLRTQRIAHGAKLCGHELPQPPTLCLGGLGGHSSRVSLAHRCLQQLQHLPLRHLARGHLHDAGDVAERCEADFGRGVLQEGLELGQDLLLRERRPQSLRHDVNRGSHRLPRLHLRVSAEGIEGLLQHLPSVPAHGLCHAGEGVGAMEADVGGVRVSLGALDGVHELSQQSFGHPRRLLKAGDEIAELLQRGHLHPPGVILQQFEHQRHQLFLSRLHLQRHGKVHEALSRGLLHAPVHVGGQFLKRGHQAVLGVVVADDFRDLGETRRGGLAHPEGRVHAEANDAHDYEAPAQVSAHGLRQAIQQLHRRGPGVLIVVVLRHRDHRHQHLVAHLVRPQVRGQGDQGIRGALPDLRGLLREQHGDNPQ